MKWIISLISISITLNLDAQDQLIQPKLLSAIDKYIENHDYKINGQGFLILEIEDYEGHFIPREEMNPSAVSLNYVLKSFDIIVHPEYDSRYLTVNTPIYSFLHENHLIFLYNGIERLLSSPLSKEFYKKNKSHFMDLNKNGYYTKFPYHTRIEFDGLDFIVQDSIMRYKSKLIFPD